MSRQFTWSSYDVRNLLPANWQESVLGLTHRGVVRNFVPNAVTSREARTDQMRICEVSGDTIRSELEWLYRAYHGIFRELAQRTCVEEVLAAKTDRYGIMLNIMRGNNMRYVCHVDSNPVAGLLYVTDHSKGSGGELVVANSWSAKNVDEVDLDCSVIYPASGNLLFFDGRFNPHYVRPLHKIDGLRVVIAMNFYTPSCAERTRPRDLDSGVIVKANLY